MQPHTVGWGLLALGPQVLEVAAMVGDQEACAASLRGP
jgi:hypothetical protein